MLFQLDMVRTPNTVMNDSKKLSNVNLLVFVRTPPKNDIPNKVKMYKNNSNSKNT